MSNLEAGRISATTAILAIRRACFWLRPLLLITVWATPQLFAQPSAPVSDSGDYLAQYAKQLALFHEVRFSYSGQQTRSTPKLGLVATWEHQGTIRVSAKRRSFHSTRASTRTKCNDVPPKYLGIRERLVTPESCLDVSIQDDISTSPPGKCFSVDCDTKIADDEWARAVEEAEFGILFGDSQFEGEVKSLLTVCQDAPIEPFEYVVDSMRLRGFRCQGDNLEIKALFDPMVEPLIRRLEVARTDENIEVGRVTHAQLTIQDVRCAAGKPTSFKLHITVTLAGGKLRRPNVPGSLTAPGKETTEIESQTWDYQYEIADIEYHDDNHDWFKLDHAIPDESPVELNGDRDWPYVWRNGNVHKIGIDDFELLVPHQQSERANLTDDVDQTAPPFSQRLASTIRNIRPCGMHCLVILAGRTPSHIVNLEHPYLAPYLPLHLNSDAIRSNASMFAARKWPLPKDDEIVLVALDGNDELLGTKRLGLNAVDEATTQASRFLNQYSPPVRDALVQLAEARTKAKQTDRNVLLVIGGVRCGPCFRLGRWIADQHDLLERDYVICKVMLELDTHAQEAVDTLGGPLLGVPQYVITDAEGTVLATSVGPTGNIGMPSAPEGIRHMREMLSETAGHLTNEELERLVQSLVDFR